MRRGGREGGWARSVEAENYRKLHIGIMIGLRSYGCDYNEEAFLAHLAWRLNWGGGESRWTMTKLGGTHKKTSSVIDQGNLIMIHVH